MAKNRIYTRKELESLRRADLQNLYKIHGLKGANQKSDALIDSLLSHFASTTYNAKPASPGGRKLRPLEVVGRVDRDVKKRIAAGGGVKDVTIERPIEEVVLSSQGVERPGTVELWPEAGPSRVTSPAIIPHSNDDMAAQMSSLTSRIAALETQPTSSTNPTPPGLAELQTQLATLQADPGGISSAELETILSERDRMWQERLRQVEQQWEDRFRILQQSLNTSPMRPGMLRGNTFGLFGGEPVPGVTRTSTTPSPRKRPNPPSPYPQTPSAGPSSPKKARIQPPTPSSDTSNELDEGSTREAEDEEPPLTPAPPRTPSPGHQGLRPDNSKSPLIDTITYFTQPPNYSSTLLPMYATTPRPSDIPLISPTVDAPPSASRARLAGTGPPPTKLLTPTRPRVERIIQVPTTRAVSDAHHGLSSITEDEGFGFRGRETPRRRVASADPHLEAGITFRDGDGSLTPSRLSPSPSIPDSGFKKPRNLPSRFGAGSRDYMEVVAHGQEPHTPTGMDERGLGETRGILGEGLYTPGVGARGHRTLLGTERWRDTRFGDVPVVQWSTPRVDLGPGTPGWGSG